MRHNQHVQPITAIDLFPILQEADKWWATGEPGIYHVYSGVFSVYYKVTDPENLPSDLGPND